MCPPRYRNGRRFSRAHLEYTVIVFNYGARNAQGSVHETEADVPVYVTQAVENKDPRANGPDFSVAKQELFRVEHRFPRYAPVMKDCFIVVFNNNDIDQEVYQARYGLQGFLGPLEQDAVHNSPN
jgi:hypothetical protein